MSRRSQKPSGFNKGVNQVAVCLAAGAGLAFYTQHPSAFHLTSQGAPAPRAHAVAVATRFARAQLGKPYIWGGTGPDGFDCSGLVVEAYQQAGIALPRTSQDQWAHGTRVPAGDERRGDLVFFAGADGTRAAPGHVGLVLNPGKHLMEEAYATGVAIRYAHYGTPSSPPGDQNPVGFTRPSAKGRR